MSNTTRRLRPSQGGKFMGPINGADTAKTPCGYCWKWGGAKSYAEAAAKAQAKVHADERWFAQALPMLKTVGTWRPVTQDDLATIIGKTVRHERVAGNSGEPFVVAEVNGIYLRPTAGRICGTLFDACSVLD